MANVLIADLHEASGYLLRALLRGRKHRVVIATTGTSAIAMLGTGQFDTLIVDLTCPDGVRETIFETAAELLPGMPIIGLGSEAQLEDAGPFAASIRRPIRGVEVKHAIQKAMTHVETHWCNRRGDSRRRVAVALTLSLGDTPFTTHTANLSTDGAAIRLTPEQQADMRDALKPASRVPVSLTLSDSIKIETLATVVAVRPTEAPEGDPSADATERDTVVQLQFTNLERPDERRIQRFLKAAA